MACKPTMAALYPGPLTDAFSRLRTSSPTGLFDVQMEYDLQPYLWETSLTSGGTITHLPNESSAQMLITATTGSKVVRQSHQHIRYQPGRSQLVLMTGVMGAIKDGVRQRIGMYDAKNGFFFEQDGTNRKVVLRSYVTGVAVDESFNQSEWNIDKLDGNGPSGINLDTSKTQIFIIEFQWLGVGRVRYGFDIGGDVVFVHQIVNANTNRTTVYMTTPNLPLQYEIEATGSPVGTTEMKQICCSVISEGGYETNRGFQFSANTGITPIAMGTTRQHAISVRLAATFGGLVNHVMTIFDSVNAMAGKDMLVEVLYNPTLGGTQTWTAVGGRSSLEFNVNPLTTITAVGSVIDSYYVPSLSAQAKQVQARAIASRLPFSLNISGVSDILTVAVTGFATQSTASAAIGWTEVR